MPRTPKFVGVSGNVSFFEKIVDFRRLKTIIIL